MSLLQRVLVAIATLVFALVFGRALGAQATIVVLYEAEASASFLDARTGAVLATAPTGEGPHEVAVSPDGRLAPVTDYGARQGGRSLAVLTVAARDGALRVYDMASRREVGVVPLRIDGGAGAGRGRVLPLGAP